MMYKLVVFLRTEPTKLFDHSIRLQYALREIVGSFIVNQTTTFATFFVETAYDASELRHLLWIKGIDVEVEEEQKEAGHGPQMAS